MYIYIYNIPASQSGRNFCLLPKKYVLHKNDRFGQTRVSSDILLPSPFFSGENARPNGKYTRPNGENTRSRGLTISHNGIFFQERHFSARTAKILVFLSNGRVPYGRSRYQTIPLLGFTAV